MNMIMHGDGHAGVHHHDGFLNVNGIFEGRFDVILTNPPFGANVEPSDVVPEFEKVANQAAEKRYTEDYGDLYTEAVATFRAAAGKPIASLFELPKGDESKIKTEILFIERCLSLLKPGGRLGIVLPEGIFNNPSLAYVREYCENRAFIRAVVSLPEETFLSSGTTVKTSLLFLQKFTSKEKADFDAKNCDAAAETDAKYAKPCALETVRIQMAIKAAEVARDDGARKALEKELAAYLKQLAETKATEARALLKERLHIHCSFMKLKKSASTRSVMTIKTSFSKSPGRSYYLVLPKRVLSSFKDSSGTMSLFRFSHTELSVCYLSQKAFTPFSMTLRGVGIQVVSAS